MEWECEAFPWEFSESPGILSQENMNLWNIVAAKTAKFNARYFRRRDKKNKYICQFRAKPLLIIKIRVSTTNTVKIVTLFSRVKQQIFNKNKSQ